MGFYLVTHNGDYDDEYTFQGWVILENDEINEFKEVLESITGDEELHYGTNGVVYGCDKDFYNIIHISGKIAYFLESAFGGPDYGVNFVDQLIDLYREKKSSLPSVARCKQDEQDEQDEQDSIVDGSGYANNSGYADGEVLK